VRNKVFVIYSSSDIGSSPFVQRVWISLEVKGLDYQYIEVDRTQHYALAINMLTCE